MTETIYGSWFSTSGASNHLRPYITYTITNTSETVATVLVTYGCNIRSGYYTTAKLTGTITTTDYLSATVTKASGTKWTAGSHVFSSGTKTYTYTRTTSKQSKTLKFKLASSTDSSTLSVNIDIDELPLCTLSYNANNGDSASIPESQSLYYGVEGTVATTIPTKTGYKFLGWAVDNAVAVDSGTVNYNPGDSITITTDTTLYASWKTDIVAPRVNSIKAYRVDSEASGEAPPLESDGTKAYFEILTDLGTNVGTNGYNKSVTYLINGSSTNGSTNVKDVTNGKLYYGYFDDILNTSSRYTLTVTITVASAQSSSVTTTFSATTYISPEKYVWDIANDGMRFAFGRKAAHNDAQTPREDFILEVEGSIDASKNLLLDLLDYNVSNSIDKNLYDAIVALGWSNEVLV